MLKNDFLGFPKVKWLCLTGEVDKSVRFLCHIFSGLLTCQKSLKLVKFWKSYSESKRWTFFETQCSFCDLCCAYWFTDKYTECTYICPFNSPFSGTTRSRYQKGKTNLNFTKATDSKWQWHQLGHTQVCTSLQTENHASTRPLSFFTGRMPFLPPNQQRQSTEGHSTDKL